MKIVVKHLYPMATEPQIAELIAAYENAWVSLTAYDNDALPSAGVTRSTAELSAQQLSDAFTEFKEVLTARGHAVELFGNERIAGGLQGIVGNVMQSIDGTPVYRTIEEQAAHLFYFIVKDHPFVDGNKRSGAYAFIWYLHRAGVLDRVKMPAPALTALTLFVAESKSEEKEKVVRLVLQLLN